MTFSGVSRVGAGRERPHQGNGNGLGSEEQAMLTEGIARRQPGVWRDIIHGLGCCSIRHGRGASGGERSLKRLAGAGPQRPFMPRNWDR